MSLRDASPHKSPILGVGPLEARVMEALWRRADWSKVGEIQALLNANSHNKPISYSAVKAVLLNLTKKRFTKKRSIGRANVFLPLRSQEEHQRQALARIVDPLLHNHRILLLQLIVSRVVADQRAIAEFERLVAQAKTKKR